MAEGIRTRVMTAAVLVVILLGVVFWLPPRATQIALTIVVLAGAWEWSAFLRVQNLVTRVTYVAVIGALLWAAWDFTAAVALSSLSSCEEEVAAGRVVLMRNDGGRPDALLLELMCSGG